MAEEPGQRGDARARAQEVEARGGNDLPIELNDAVLACIDLYQGRLRDWFEGAPWPAGGRYLPAHPRGLRRRGHPQDLAYLALVESAFKPGRLSRAKAKGVWQFISGDGQALRPEQDWWVDERSDPEKATRAAARYLKELYGMFGDWNLAMAGYNAGEDMVQRGLDRYRRATTGAPRRRGPSAARPRTTCR